MAMIKTMARTMSCRPNGILPQGTECPRLVPPLRRSLAESIEWSPLGARNNGRLAMELDGM